MHTADYVSRAYRDTFSNDEVRRIGFLFSAELVERARRSVGGTISASKTALEDGVAINLAGGTHHGFAGHDEGFCVFNDVAVAVRAHQAVNTAGHFSVLDLDVHRKSGSPNSALSPLPKRLA